jgi:hypothetical protein
MITEPTRTCNTRQSLLDPVLVSDDCNVLESYVIQVDRKYSDHEATIVLESLLDLRASFRSLFRFLISLLNSELKQTLSFSLIVTSFWGTQF